MISRRERGKLAIDMASLEVASKAFTVIVVFISLLIILQLFGLDIAPLIAFGGIGAAAIGIASRDVIANFFGGLMLYVTRPFTLGDFIELPHKAIQGTVEEVGWYLTSIRDGEKKPIYIPNSLFSTELLVNHSRMTHRKLDETLSLSHKDAEKIEEVIEVIRELLRRHASIDVHQSIDVHLTELFRDAFSLEVKAYVLATRYEEFMEIKQKVLLAIYREIKAKGAEIALPASAVHLYERRK